jgi:hypothetical protein
MSDNVVPIEGRKRNGSDGRTRGHNNKGPSGISYLEQSAPVFKDPKEYEKWLDGKPTRRDIIMDMRRVSDGMAYFAAMLEAMQTQHEALLKELLSKGVIDFEEYTRRVRTQQAFKSFLDAINFGVLKDKPYAEKIEGCLQWNAEHPEWQIRGAYVIGLLEFLKLTEENGGLPLIRRAEVASELSIKEEDIFTQEEVDLVIARLNAASASGGTLPATEVTNDSEGSN